MALTPLPSSIWQGSNPWPSNREPSALLLDLIFRYLENLKILFCTKSNNIRTHTTIEINNNKKECDWIKDNKRKFEKMMCNAFSSKFALFPHIDVCQRFPTIFCSRTPKQKKKKIHVTLCKVYRLFLFFPLTIWN